MNVENGILIGKKLGPRSLVMSSGTCRMNEMEMMGERLLTEQRDDVCYKYRRAKLL